MAFFFPLGIEDPRVSSPFGPRGSGFHGGVDFAVPIGTSVVAPISGTVRTVKNLEQNSYGLYVVIRGTDGRDYYFAHLSATAVQQGQRVTGGQVIARTGNTGNSTGPHLHFEVRQGGDPVNPSFIFSDDVQVVGGGGQVLGNVGQFQSFTTSAEVAAQFKQAGFAVPFDISKYVNQAIRSGSQNPFLMAYGLVVESPEFERAFPGIKRSDGTLRMTVADYLKTEEAYKSVAAQFGFNINRARAGTLIALEVSPDEFVERARAVQTLRANPEVREFLAFQTGLRSVKEQMDFVLGRSDNRVYERYEAAVLGAAAQSAGITLGGPGARGLARTTEGVLTVEQAEERFGRIAQRLRAAGPELRSFGITGRDLQILEFGGPGRGDIALRAERALAQREAALQGEIAQPRAGLTEQGRPVVAGAPEPGF